VAPLDPNEAGRELIAFFRALSPEARREYQLLAELDRRYGEDVRAEQREQRIVEEP
jgi:hypothetical protein